MDATHAVKEQLHTATQEIPIESLLHSHTWSQVQVLILQTGEKNIL